MDFGAAVVVPGVAALVVALGGTPEQADKVWDQVKNMPVARQPSMLIYIVRDLLDEIRRIEGKTP